MKVIQAVLSRALKMCPRFRMKTSGRGSPSLSYRAASLLIGSPDSTVSRKHLREPGLHVYLCAHIRKYHVRPPFHRIQSERASNICGRKHEQSEKEGTGPPL
ncbi:hypothetical protein QQF64_034760 [Cirrhinus molitorella]|uniref:Uncharacterized protein n=1 Tax=Cirrhinus molitorella TaxID=172907 RepID=A0ABR3L424_9TELE